MGQALLQVRPECLDPFKPSTQPVGLNLPIVFMLFRTKDQGTSLCLTVNLAGSGLNALILFGIRGRLEVASTGCEQSNNRGNKQDQYLILGSQSTFSEPHLY